MQCSEHESLQFSSLLHVESQVEPTSEQLFHEKGTLSWQKQREFRIAIIALIRIFNSKLKVRPWHYYVALHEMWFSGLAVRAFIPCFCFFVEYYKKCC
jgi:hypothetical protein